MHKIVDDHGTEKKKLHGNIPPHVIQRIGRNGPNLELTAFNNSSEKNNLQYESRNHVAFFIITNKQRIHALGHKFTTGKFTQFLILGSFTER